MIDLITAFKLIATTDWLRICLIYSHFVVCALAISAVIKTDIAIVTGQFTRKELEFTAHMISKLLIALWVRGLAIIYIDTGFSPETLQAKPKLLIKLMCVSILTLNGRLLHHISFPILTKDTSALKTSELVLLVTTGALSTSHWMLAAFVGMTKPLDRLPFENLFVAYGVYVLSVITISLLFIPFISNVKQAFETPVTT